MKIFIQYLFCSLSGRSFRLEYDLEEVDWDQTVINFQEFSSTLSVDENVLTSISDNEICIQEFYDSGLRYRGSSMTINNEVLVTISKYGDRLKVTVDFWRAAESRLLTNISIILSFVFTMLFAFGVYNWGFRSEKFDALLFLLLHLVFDSVVILMWKISKMKYTEIKKRIEKIMQS